MKITHKEIIIMILNEYVKPEIYENYNSEIDFYSHIIELFYNKKSKYTKTNLYSICVEHGIRVCILSELIMNYHEKINFNTYSKDERYIVKIAALFHDIGKLYKKKNHAKWSEVIMNYFFTLEFKKNKNINIENCNKIRRIISYHSNKEEYRDIISDLTKVVRDADRLDEMCGESLLDLALSYVKNNKDIDYNNLEKANLNYLDYKLSDMIMAQRNSKETKAMIKRELNFEVDYDLYLQLLQYANEEYDRRTQYHRFRDKFRVHIF